MPTGLTVALGISFVLLVVAVVGHRIEQIRFGRTMSVSGFLVFAITWLGFTLTYLHGAASAMFLAGVSFAACLLGLHAARLCWVGWDRAPQLSRTTAAILALGLPFQIYPILQLTLQESLAAQTAMLLGGLGHQPSLQSVATGGLIKLRFENQGYLVISEACTGVGAAALFSGIILGARTSVRKKLAGVGTVLVTVYVLNTVRITFVAVAMAGNWFAPMFGSESLQLTYYISEILIGQTFVIIASVVAFVYLSRWIPDMRHLATALLDTFQLPGLTEAA